VGGLLDKLLFPGTSTYRHDRYPNIVWIPTRHTISDPSRRVPAMFFRYPGSQLLIIYSHGNACDCGEMYRDMSDYSKHFKAHVIGYEYPNYGCYHGYVATEASINETLEDVLTFVRTYLDWPTNQLVFFGRSLGTGPTIKAVADLEENKCTVGGMILQSAYTSIKDVAQNVTGAAKVLQVNRWENLKRISKIKCPVLFIHGKQDKLIPYQHSQKLFDVCQSQSKALHLVEHADHNTWADETDIIKPGKAFLEKFVRVENGTKKGDDPDIDSTFYIVPDKQKIADELKSKVISVDGRERDWSLVGYGGYHKSNDASAAASASTSASASASESSSVSSSSSSSVGSGSVSSHPSPKHEKQPSLAPSVKK